MRRILFALGLLILIVLSAPTALRAESASHVAANGPRHIAGTILALD